MSGAACPNRPNMSSHEYAVSRREPCGVTASAATPATPRSVGVRSVHACICLMVCVPVYRGFVGRVIGEKLTM